MVDLIIVPPPLAKVIFTINGGTKIMRVSLIKFYKNDTFYQIYINVKKKLKKVRR